MKRPDSQEWIYSKDVGDAGELIVSECLRQLGFEVVRLLEKGPYDLKVTASVEVKRDLQFAKSGNVAVEVACNRKPSGISISEADFWAFVLGQEIVFVSTESLRQSVNSGNWRQTSGGDWRRATLCLLPLTELKRISQGWIVNIPSPLLN